MTSCPKALLVFSPGSLARWPPAPFSGQVVFIRLSTRHASVAVLVAVLCLTVGVGQAVSSPGSASKRAEAQKVLAEIHSIDLSLERATEAYNAAQVRLGEIKSQLEINEKRLEIARANFHRAQASLADRLKALYMAGDETALEVLLGATSLDDLLNRIDTVNRVTAQDVRIVGEVRRFRAEVQQREAELKSAENKQAALVSERAAKRASIEQQLSERQRLLDSIKSEIARIEAAERARQARLEAQARQRIASTPTVNNAPTGGGAGFGGGNPAGHYSGVVAIAMRYLGVPYVWGGASPSGFDCSGLTMYVYAQVGVSLPHNAAMQYGYGSPVSRENLQPGDLVFFDGLGHMGMYIGGGQFIHAPHTGDVVKISTLTGWYADTYVGARRL